MRSGGHKGSTCTPVPIFMRCVRAAIALATSYRRREHRVLGGEMKLGEPENVDASLLAGVDLLKGSGKCLGLRPILEPVEFVEYAKFHSSSPLPRASLDRSAGHCIGELTAKKQCGNCSAAGLRGALGASQKCGRTASLPLSARGGVGVFQGGVVE